MLRKIFVFGSVSGLTVGIGLSAVIVATTGNGMSNETGMAIGYSMMLVALSLIFVAIKRHRDEEGGGVIRFVTAFGLGLGISTVAGIVYVCAWETVMAVTEIDYMANHIAASVEAERAKGVSGEALTRHIAELEAFRVRYTNPLFLLPIRFVEVFPVGVLVTLVSAALLRNPRFLAARREPMASLA